MLGSRIPDWGSGPFSSQQLEVFQGCSYGHLIATAQRLETRNWVGVARIEYLIGKLDLGTKAETTICVVPYLHMQIGQQCSLGEG